MNAMIDSYLSDYDELIPEYGSDYLLTIFTGIPLNTAIEYTTTEAA